MALAAAAAKKDVDVDFPLMDARARGGALDGGSRNNAASLSVSVVAVVVVGDEGCDAANDVDADSSMTCSGGGDVGKKFVVYALGRSSLAVAFAARRSGVDGAESAGAF